MELFFCFLQVLSKLLNRQIFSITEHINALQALNTQSKAAKRFIRNKKKAQKINNITAIGSLSNEMFKGGFL